jgi:hypothetical protein
MFISFSVVIFSISTLRKKILIAISAAMTAILSISKIMAYSRLLSAIATIQVSVSMFKTFYRTFAVTMISIPKVFKKMFQSLSVVSIAHLSRKVKRIFIKKYFFRSFICDSEIKINSVMEDLIRLGSIIEMDDIKLNSPIDNQMLLMSEIFDGSLKLDSILGEEDA